jgi:hypothetical protein
MALPEQTLGFHDATPLEQADITPEVIDSLWDRDSEDVVFWSAIRSTARTPVYSEPSNKYLDLGDDSDLFNEVMR